MYFLYFLSYTYGSNMRMFCVLFVVFLFSSCSHAPRKPIEARNGTIDLSTWLFEADGSVPLGGEWEFYWENYLKGADFEQEKKKTVARVPDSWTNYGLPSAGYATYRLKVKIPQEYINNTLLGIKIPIVATAYQLFIQNNLVSPPRTLGTSAQTTKGQYDPDVYFFMPRQETLEVVLHVANYHGRLGGLTRLPILGEATQIRKEYENGLIVSFLLIGIIFVIGCHHASLYLFRKREKCTLYFAFFCFIISLRSFVTDDYYLTELFPQSDIEVGNKIAYLTFYLSVPVFAIFVRSLYPQDFSIYVTNIILSISAVFVVITLFTKGFFYSRFLVYYQLATILIILYGTYLIVVILIKRREDSRVFAFGTLVIFFSTVNDILVTNLLFGTQSLIPAGLLLFIFSQTLIISRKFSRVYRQVENLSAQLKANHQELELAVGQRTVALKEANEELSQNLEELNTNLEIINEQKIQIHGQHKSITSSITYAKNIQSNILPAKTFLNELFPDNFLIFKPKDIVSGDFYYFNEANGKIILAAIDCTGHGVPGAFMSVIGYSLLSEIIESHYIIEPAYILKSLHIGIRTFLRQEAEASTSRDGMDIALVVIDKGKREIKFAGAKNPLVYIRNGEINVLQGDNLYIGGNMSRGDITFTQTAISLSKEETFSFYLFSDGYQDQFGGEENKKLMKKHFRELLYQISDLPMREQGELLAEWHEAWKGSLAQTDDILVMGVRMGDIALGSTLL
jgi:serine phosphatase RsbU (regulator of sigma subunit)